MQGVTVKDSKVRITDECEQVEERERMGEYVMRVSGLSRELIHVSLTIVSDVRLSSCTAENAKNSSKTAT